jgi:acetyl/propionyl-CoA carboxylase alpha subunit
MAFELSIDGAPTRLVGAVSAGASDGVASARVAIDGRAHRAGLTAEGGRHTLELDGIRTELEAAVDGDTVWLHAFGRAWEVEIVDPAQRAERGAVSRDVLSAPMPGTVIAVGVAPGEAVRHAQVLVVIESMKMQSEITAPRAGMIASVNVALGDVFERGATLVALAPLAGEDG